MQGSVENAFFPPRRNAAVVGCLQDRTFAGFKLNRASPFRKELASNGHDGRGRFLNAAAVIVLIVTAFSIHGVSPQG